MHTQVTRLGMENGGPSKEDLYASTLKGEGFQASKHSKCFLDILVMNLYMDIKVRDHNLTMILATWDCPARKT